MLDQKKQKSHHHLFYLVLLFYWVQFNPKFIQHPQFIRVFHYIYQVQVI